MKNGKRIGTCIALAATVGVLGVTAYGVGNNENADTVEEEQRITLNVATDAEEDTDSQEDAAGETQAEETEAAETETAQTEAAEDNSAQAAEIAEKIQVIPTLSGDADSDGMPNVQDVAENVMPAIVILTNVSKEEINYFGRTYEADATITGSGIIIGKSDTELMIATNNHIVSDADELTVCFSVDMEDDDDQDKAIVSAQVKGTDSKSDLAVVAVDLTDIDPEVAEKIGIVQLGSSSDLKVGQWVVAIGNALGEGQSVTVGIVSALDRQITATDGTYNYTNNVIQTDAAINHGNSGGALLDMQGRLVGINESKTTANDAEGMGYAIPVDSAKDTLEELMNQTTRSKVDESDAGALGVTVVDVSDEAQQLYNIPAGALVYSLTDSSAAKDAGIEEGDIIVGLDGSTISSRTELLERMKYYAAGETVTVTVQRSGDSGYQEQSFDVTLGKKSDLEGYSSDSQEDSQDSQDGSQDDGYQYEYYDSNSGGSGLEDLFRNFGF